VIGASSLARPIYLENGNGPVFGLFHAPAGGSQSPTAVLICGPWGWDEVASYRSRRAWADFLSEHGHPVLRIDLPGTGDSAGTPEQPDLVATWTRAIEMAAGWLAGQPGVARVAVIGLGLGGLLAAASIADGVPIHDLVLWAAPSTGRAFVREQRAFAALQGTRLEAAEGPPGPEPPGLEVGGFVLSAETAVALGRLELGATARGRLDRVLLLDRDGMAVDGPVRAHLERLGADLTVASGRGWTDMVFHPEQYAPPLGVFAEVEAWLARWPAGTTGDPGVNVPEAANQVELSAGHSRIRETPIRIDQPFGQIFGVLAEPVGVPRSTACAIFLNAGAVRRTGPNRLWVEASRRWAAAGVPTIRMDLEGIGEADGDPARYRAFANYYTPEFGTQVPSILEALEARGLGPRFVLIGLCAGAYWAFNTGAQDRRVIEAIIVNPRVMVWDPELLTRREARKVERLRQPDLWRRVLRGDVPVTRMLEVSRALAATAARAAVRAPGRLRNARSSPLVDPAIAQLDSLRDHSTRVVLAFSGDEPVYDELAADGILGQLARWPNVVLEELPGSDHTLRPLAAQRALHALLERELDALVAAG
jgi:pimeloyl-ACP methyl ester carboxylesterase